MKDFVIDNTQKDKAQSTESTDETNQDRTPFEQTETYTYQTRHGRQIRPPLRYREQVKKVHMTEIVVDFVFIDNACLRQ